MPAVRLGAPDSATRAEALLADAVALQLLTPELCLAGRHQPRPHPREQPLYRRVAEAARAG